MANEIETAMTALATQAALGVTAQGTQSTAIDALTTAVTALSLPQGVPAGSTPFTACNQAAADTADTPVVVFTNPGATRLFITEARLFNVTTAEIAAGRIQDENDVILAYLGTSSFDGMAIAADRGVHKFNPPLIVDAGLDVEWNPFATVGDVYCAVVGYIEP